MAYTQKPWLNKVYLVWFFINVVSILLVDAVKFYPEWIYSSKSSPLHFLPELHDFYVRQFNDPIMQWDPSKGPGLAWTEPMGYIVVLYQLPTAFYGFLRLGGFVGSKTTTGREELHYVVYAFQTAFTTMICIHNIFYWDPEVYSDAQKSQFIYQLYMPWLAIPSLMFVDMYLRLQSRLGALDVQKKVQ